MKAYELPLLIRGELIYDDMVEYEGRRGGQVFRTPDVSKYLDRLPLADPSKMADMYALRFAEVVDYLAELGTRLVLDRNPHLQEALELSCATSGLTPEILRYQYRRVLPSVFNAGFIRELADARIGIERLEGWTRQSVRDGRIAYVRPFGARCAHVTAGNVPMVAGITTIWNGITRGDAVIKTPSNDPLTALAIGRTMVEMAPDHPLTKHFSVAYWKGGDRGFESEFYTPKNFEKIVAWGGFSSMKHITRYLQPGLELVALDPKLSGSIIGKEVFESEAAMRDVAARLAVDMGGLNQEGCASARVVSVQSGTDPAGLARLTKLAQYTYEALQALPVELSAPHLHFDKDLKAELAAIRKSSFYTIVGDLSDRGAIVVSNFPDPVDFADQLACRVANFVPFDDIEEALKLITIHTQTIGVYPESLKEKYRDRLAFLGGQRITSVGYHLASNISLPQDGIEPLRRLCRWIVEENCTVEGFPDREAAAGSAMNILNKSREAQRG